MSVISNPTFNPNLPESATNQRMIFETPQVINQQTGQMNTGEFTTPIITPGLLEPAKPVDLPKAPEDWYNYSGITAENTSIADLFKSIQTEEKPTDFTTMFKDLYAETGLAQQEQGILEKQTSLKSAQNEFNLINAQLKALSDQANIAPVQIEKEFAGRAGVQQQELMSRARQRDIAIQSLPLQGQAYLAQAKVLAAQGDVETSQKALEIATSKFNTIFTIQSKQAEIDYDYRKDLRDKIYEYATEKEKQKLATLQEKDDREFTLLQNNLNYAQTLSTKAIESGQGNLAAKITALDPKSANYTQDLANLAGQIRPKAEAVAGTEKITTISKEWETLINSTGNLSSTKSIGDEIKNSLNYAINNGDYVSAYAQIANAVEDKLTGEVKTKFANTRNDYLIIENFKQALQDYADAGGNMGYLTGKEEEIKRKLGIDSGKATQLAVQLWREFQTYRLNMTGAAFSEAESRDYASVNPTLGKSLNLNLSVISGALKQLENRLTSTINARLPDAKKLYQKISGEIEEVNPETAPIGATIEIDGKKYIKLGEDKFEEQIYSFNPTGK